MYRQYSDIYYAIAITHIYKCTQEGVNKAEQKQLAIESYTKAKQVLNALVQCT